jgi:kinesin family protein 5
MAAAREAPGEDSIRVVCRFRPINDAEEIAGSEFIVNFPPDTGDRCVNLEVRFVQYK